MSTNAACIVCESAEANPHRAVDGIGYFRCAGCASRFADPGFARGDIGLDALFTRLWTPHPDNMAMLAACRFGPLMIGAGLESSRVCLEHAAASWRIDRVAHVKRGLASRWPFARST